MTAFAANIVHFARILRKAGLPVGTGKITTALDALTLIDISRRDDVFQALRTVFVERRAHDAVFRVAFERFFRAPAQEEVTPSLSDESQRPGARRVDDAFGIDEPGEGAQQGDGEALSWSRAETLRQKDFAAMSAAEIAEATRLIATLRLPLDMLRTRRFRAGGRGVIDMRAMLRNMVRSGGVIDLAYKQRTKRPPTLVVLCDISGSMEAYCRMMLRFLHALTTDRDRMHVFLFGTRLTNVTREIARRDPDEALARVAKAVADWSGGTRIAESLKDFNRLWARRVLSQGAVVLLISDGLERGSEEGLAQEMAHLHRASRRLIWLNPLLRYGGFEAKAAGIRAMLPHVDDFRPVHSLDSLAGLVAALGAPAKMAA